MFSPERHPELEDFSVSSVQFPPMVRVIFDRLTFLLALFVVYRFVLACFVDVDFVDDANVVDVVDVVDVINVVDVVDGSLVFVVAKYDAGPNVMRLVNSDGQL
jgi:hypothetical protein